MPIYLLSDSPYSRITRYRPLVWGDGLTAEWAVALRAVIAECQSARGLHNYCKPQDLAPLPTRVLQITAAATAAEAEASGEVGGSFAQVRLHITPKKGQGQLGRYAALSYCWGGPQEVRLTRDNLDLLQEGIPHAENRLPQTLRDAVVATQLLGLEYLWVDALCIVQDDPADKAREIDRMCAIYENSTVTLVAATARSVRDGFLRPATVVNERFASCELEVSFSPSFFDKEKIEIERETVGESTRSGGGASGSDGGSRGSTLIFTPMHRHHTEAFPVNARGWTFQESFIPPRVLVFGDQEPFLRCRSGDDIVATKTCVRYDLTSRMRPRRLVTRHLKIEGVSLDDVADRLADVWPQVVEEYTSRELSFPLEDRPLAVRGVIDFLSAAFGGDTCRFGVWASCPVACLLWQKTIVHGNGGGSWESVRIPRLPTWSWMSVTGQVDLYHMILLGNHRGLAQVEFDDEKKEQQHQKQQQQQQPHNEHHQLFITCHMLMEEEVRQAGDITEFRPDLTVLGSRIDQEGKVIVAGSDKDEGCSLLVLASTTDRKLVAIAATSASENGNDTYQRRGLVEIKYRDKWLSNAQRRVVLM